MSPPGYDHAGKSVVLGTYGARGPDHPRFNDYVWVDWFGKTPTAGYYPRRILVEVGTAFIEGDDPAMARP